MRDKLIKILQDLALSDDPCVDGLFEWADGIADYLLDNGVIVSPCKIRDTIWYIDKNYNIQNAEVTCIDLRGTSKHIIATRYVWETEETVKLALMFEQFNVDYWLTRAEAERALAERRTNND